MTKWDRDEKAQSASGNNLENPSVNAWNLFMSKDGLALYQVLV
jgi:hypothetical protein